MNSKFALLTVTSIGTAGGVGGLGYWYSIPKDLKEVLIKEGKKLLDVYGDTNDSDWKNLAQKYQSSEETITLVNDAKVSKISNFKIITTGNNSEPFKQLKEQCKKLFETRATKENNFETSKKDAINWCIKDSDALTKEIKSSPSSRSGESTGVRSAPAGDSGPQQAIAQASTEPNGREGQTDVQLPNR